MTRVIIRVMTMMCIVYTFASCEKDKDPGITMVDGRVVHLSTDKVTHYDTEEAFCMAFTFDFPTMYSCLTDNLGPYDDGVDYSIVGFDDKFIGWWEKATFGEWAKEYGLTPGRTYYCATIKYVAYVPQSDEIGYIPIGPFDNVGYTPWSTDSRGYFISLVTNTPYKAFETYFRYIGYDESRQGTYKELPSTNRIVWNFAAKKPL